MNYLICLVSPISFLFSDRYSLYLCLKKNHTYLNCINGVLSLITVMLRIMLSIGYEAVKNTLEARLRSKCNVWMNIDSCNYIFLGGICFEM